ncbi:MAG: Trk system potassium transporter TrkA [Gemmatimonadales bacterium]
MRVIVVGAGEVGYHVADRLSKEGHDIVVVDVNDERLEYVQAHLDVAVVEGSGASPSALKDAGIDKAGLLLAVTSIDEVNLVCCMTAPVREGLVRVARVSNPDFYREHGQLEPGRFGVDLLINPERELALEAFRLLQSTAATDVHEFADGAVQLIGLFVTATAPIAGRTLADIGRGEGGRALLTVALEREGVTTVPSGDTVIRVGDHIYVVAAAQDIPRALELCGHEITDVRRVMVGGGSTEAYYLARLLQQHGVQPVMLVADRARAQDLAERLDKTLVLNGDVTDIELLELEGVGGMDAFVALTERDETNLIASLVAHHAGARQVVTLVNKSDFIPLARRLGLDAAVSPRLSAANAILRYVRRGNVTRVATFKESDAEVMSIEVRAESPLVGRPLGELDFPDDAIVAAVVRNREVIVPRGDHVFQPGDTAIIFALPNAISAVTRLFPS